ncbi:hypothetical protein JCM11641_004726 [Rhodosporidiobolus odoratus]
MDRPTPRVNASRLASYPEGKIVRLIGKVISLDGDAAIVEASDGGQITVKLGSMSDVSATFIEVVGKITGNNSMSELSSLNLGESIDMVAVDKVVELTHAYPDVYPVE